MNKALIAILLATVITPAMASVETATKSAREFVDSQLTYGKPRNLIQLTSSGQTIFMEFDMGMELPKANRDKTLAGLKHEFCWRQDLKAPFAEGVVTDVSFMFRNEKLHLVLDKTACGL